MIKKLSVLSLMALSTTSVVAAEALDSRFTFLSGGVAFDSNGLAKESDIKASTNHRETVGLRYAF